MRTLFAALVLSLLALAAGCKGSKGQGAAARALSVSSVRVKDRSAADHRIPGFGEKQVEAMVRKRLAAAPALRLETKEKGYRLRVEYGLGPRQGKEGLAALVVVRLDPGLGGGIPLESSLIAPLEAKKGAKKGIDRRAHLERALGAALGEVFWQAELVGQPAEALVAGLRAEKDPERLLKRIPILAERRVKKAVPALIALLTHEKRAVVDRAMGALATLGDPRAVKPLTKLAKLRDSRRLAQVIDAVAAIGGPEAASFLDFLAGGHADPTIRNLAREARERMKRPKVPGS